MRCLSKKKKKNDLKVQPREQGRTEQNPRLWKKENLVLKTLYYCLYESFMDKNNRRRTM